MVKILSAASILLVFVMGLAAQENTVTEEKVLDISNAPAADLPIVNTPIVNTAAEPIDGGTLLVNFYEIEGDTDMTSVMLDHHYVPAVNIRGALLQDGETLFTFDTANQSTKLMAYAEDNSGQTLPDSENSTIQFNNVPVTEIEIVAEDKTRGYFGSEKLDTHFNSAGTMEVNMLLSENGLIRLPDDMSKLEDPVEPAQPQPPVIPRQPPTNTNPMPSSTRGGGWWALGGLAGLAGLAGLSKVSPYSPSK